MIDILDRLVIAGAADEAHARVVFPRNHPVAIVFDLMHPLSAGGGARCCCREAGRDEAGWQGTRTQRPHGAGAVAALLRNVNKA
jgi:hypothetical protein